MTPLKSSSNYSAIHNSSLMLGAFYDVVSGESVGPGDARQHVDDQVEWPVTELVVRFNTGLRDELKYKVPT